MAGMLKNTTTLLLLFVVARAEAAQPDQVIYPAPQGSLFWFLVVSDSHIDEEELTGNKASDNLQWVASELFQTVSPVFLVNTGDLTDASGGGPMPTGPKQGEWDVYRQIILDNGLTPAVYHDLPGNHDHYNDKDTSHYLQYSISGAENGTINQSWVHETDYGRYLFVGIATCASDGLPWPADNSGLDETDRIALDAALLAEPEATGVYFFGHHPISYMGQGVGFLTDRMEEHGVSLYSHGHIHDITMFWEFGAFQFSLRSLGKSPNKQVALIAIDGDGMSLQALDVGAWPLVQVTSPWDAELGGSNPYDIKIPGDMDQAPVRAIAFDPGGVAAVDLQIDNGEWLQMESVADNVWEGAFDATTLNEYPHKLRVRATPAAGDPAVHEIIFYIDPVEIQPPEPQPEISPEIGPEPSNDVVESVLEVAGQPDEIITLNEIVADLPASPDMIFETSNPDSPPDLGSGPDLPVHSLSEGGGGDGGCGPGAGPAGLWTLLAALACLVSCRRKRT